MFFFFLLFSTFTFVICFLLIKRYQDNVHDRVRGAGLVICLDRGADLHTAQLMLLPITVSCFSKIQIGFTFLVLAHPGIPGQRAIELVCVLLR